MLFYYTCSVIICLYSFLLLRYRETFEYESDEAENRFFMQIASVSATGKTARSILVSDVFISRERKCRSGVHPMTFAHNHSRTFHNIAFSSSPCAFINTWEVRNEY